MGFSVAAAVIVVVIVSMLLLTKHPLLHCNVVSELATCATTNLPVTASVNEPALRELSQQFGVSVRPQTELRA